MFKECANAYECLSDSEKRLNYDMFGTASVPRTGAHDAEAFEQMFGVGSGAPKKRRTVGGALFVDDAKGQFFQRTWDISDVEKMRQEMAEGLPASQTQVAYDGASYTACTTLPHGAAWEVALVEASTELTITLIANDKEGDAPSTLRIERTFALPPSTTSGWDLGGAEVDVSDAGVLRVTMAKVAGAGASSPSTPHAMDGAMPAPRTPLKQKRGVRRAKRPQASGMRAGFLNSKPRGAAAELSRQHLVEPAQARVVDDHRLERPVVAREVDLPRVRVVARAARARGDGPALADDRVAADVGDGARDVGRRRARREQPRVLAVARARAHVQPELVARARVLHVHGLHLGRRLAHGHVHALHLLLDGLEIGRAHV